MCDTAERTRRTELDGIRWRVYTHPSIHPTTQPSTHPSTAVYTDYTSKYTRRAPSLSPSPLSNANRRPSLVPFSRAHRYDINNSLALSAASGSRGSSVSIKADDPPRHAAFVPSDSSAQEPERRCGSPSTRERKGVHQSREAKEVIGL